MASNASRSLIRHSTALSYLTPQVSAKASNAASASFLVSAIQISWSARLAFDCWLLGSLFKTLAVLCTQQRWPRVLGHTSSTACQKPRAPRWVLQGREDACCIVAGHLPAIHQAQPLIWRPPGQGPPALTPIAQAAGMRWRIAQSTEWPRHWQIGQRIPPALRSGASGLPAASSELKACSSPSSDDFRV